MEGTIIISQVTAINMIASQVKYSGGKIVPNSDLKRGKKS
jgi:hypothetical protein